MRWITCALLILLAATTVAATSDPIYLRIIPKQGDGEDLLDMGMTGGCYLSRGDNCEALFYDGENGSGVRMGSIQDDPPEGARLEMICNVQYLADDDAAYLVGTVYMMYIDKNDEIVSGQRRQFKQPIRPGVENVLAQPVGQSKELKTVFLQFETFAKQPQPVEDFKEFPVLVISSDVEGGKQLSQARNRFDSLDDPIRFRTGFGKNTAEDSLLTLNYEVEIRLDADVDLADWSATAELGESKSCQLSLRRRYAVSSSALGGGTLTFRGTYASEYQKRVNLVAGQKLALVFPPDTPSVHGFNIEDTLIIAP